MSTPFDLLPEDQRKLISDCVNVDDSEVAGDLFSRAVSVAQADSTFRFVCASLTQTAGVGIIDRVQHICRIVEARIAANAAVNSWM